MDTEILQTKGYIFLYCRIEHLLTIGMQEYKLYNDKAPTTKELKTAEMIAKEETDRKKAAENRVQQEARNAETKGPTDYERNVQYQTQEQQKIEVKQQHWQQRQKEKQRYRGRRRRQQE